LSSGSDTTGKSTVDLRAFSPAILASKSDHTKSCFRNMTGQNGRPHSG
jgi:hypothetical protein